MFAGYNIIKNKDAKNMSNTFNINIQDQNMYELCIGWLLFWTTYFSVGLLLPKECGKSRPSAHIDNNKIKYCLLKNRQQKADKPEI